MDTGWASQLVVECCKAVVAGRGLAINILITLLRPVAYSEFGMMLHPMLQTT